MSSWTAGLLGATNDSILVADIENIKNKRTEAVRNAQEVTVFFT
jgi:hypothetical protein